MRVGLALLSALTIAVVPTAAAQLPIASFHSFQSRDPIQLEQEGRAFYTAGQFDSAAQFWREAAQAFGDRDETLAQAGSLSYLSMALYELGQWEEANDAVARSLSLLPDTAGGANGAVLAQGLNNQGRIQLALGDAESALETWRSAAGIYAEISDEMGKLGAETNQAIALQTLGLYRRSQTLLEQVNQALLKQPDSRLKAAGLRNLGIALQVVGDLPRARSILEQSWVIGQQLDFPPDISATLRALGHTARAQQDPEAALAYYQEAVSVASGLPLEAVLARLGQLGLEIELQRWEEATATAQTLQAAIPNLPPSRATVYAAVNFAQNQMDLELRGQEAEPIHGTVSSYHALAQILARAIEQAKTLNDPRAESYAIGQLGHLYEQTQQWNEALALTRNALLVANRIEASDITAKWQGQLGRLLKQQGDRDGAIAAYTEAVQTFQSLRQDLVAIDPEVQFSFQETVEPVYRELVSLLLSSPQPSQKSLIQARETIEGLQIAELDNFFREACLKAQSVQVDRIDPKAAAIYPIIVPDEDPSSDAIRLEVILSLPGQPLKNYTTVLPQEEFDYTVTRFRQSLSLSFPKSERLVVYRQVYDWLIRPIEAELAHSGIETLVFVPDGVLRNLPMAVLYNGEQYLIEKYSLALSPGLQLLEPQTSDNTRLQALIGGLSESRQGFQALPGVRSEVDGVRDAISSEVWLDRDFTTEAVRVALSNNPNSILHLATHGQFSSNAEDTFILTWDSQLQVNELGNLLRRRDETGFQTLELLVLSACQTAKGDSRAILGLAGLAVKSGARSTLATLWSVRDQSTADLMAQFYQQLALSGTSKSEALRQAQLSLLRHPQYDHPFYWAPFVLVGNWL